MKVNNYPLKTPAAGDKLFGSDASGDQHQFDMSNFITYVNSVTGLDTDNTDPLNPVVQIAVDGVTITGDGTSGNPLVSVSGSGFQFTYEIGQYVVAEGGVIAHRWLSTTPNGTPTAGTTENYIVVDLNNLAVSAQWATLFVDISNVESTYDGETNTINLIAAGAGSGITVGTAAEFCDVSIAGGQTDWYLPAVDELSRLWQNRWEVAQGLGVVGGTQLGFNNYWSSTEYDSSTAWDFSLTSGSANLNVKGATNYVRAVRRFSI